MPKTVAQFRLTEVPENKPAATRHSFDVLEASFDVLEAGDMVEGCSIGFRFGFAGSNQ